MSQGEARDYTTGVKTTTGWEAKDFMEERVDELEEKRGQEYIMTIYTHMKKRRGGLGGNMVTIKTGIMNTDTKQNNGEADTNQRWTTVRISLHCRQDKMMKEAEDRKAETVLSGYVSFT